MGKLWLEEDEDGKITIVEEVDDERREPDSRYDFSEDELQLISAYRRLPHARQVDLVLTAESQARPASLP